MDVRRDAVATARQRVSDRTAATFDYTVQSGPYAGSRLGPRQYWGSGDVGCKVLGLYELEVQRRLVDIQGRHRRSTLLDVGAGDGYHVIGAAHSGLFQRVVAFEAASGARELLYDNIRRNGVDDRVSVHRAADADNFIDVIQEAGLSPTDCVALIDIEGYEYELLDDTTLTFFADTDLIVEIHDEIVFDLVLSPGPHPPSDLRPQQDLLAAKASRTHHLEVLHSGGRDLFPFEQLREWDDNDRALVASEGRSRLGIWWHFQPRSTAER